MTNSAMCESEQFVVFRLDEQRCALPLGRVERVTRAVEHTLLPKAPEIVLGVIDINGSVLPLIDIRRLFHLHTREIRTADHFLIAKSERRTVVLVIDQAEGVIDLPSVEIVGACKIIPGIDRLRGVAKLPDGLLLIHDIESFLSLEEERALDQAIEESLRGA